MGRNTGVTQRVWAVVQALPGPTFTSREVAMAGEFVSVKSIGKAMSYLINAGLVEIAEKVRFHGDPFMTCIYKLGDGKRGEKCKTSLPAQSDAAPGVRQVRLTDTRHWHHEPSTSRPWRGYQSGLARVA